MTTSPEIYARLVEVIQPNQSFLITIYHRHGSERPSMTNVYAVTWENIGPLFHALYEELTLGASVNIAQSKKL